MDPEDLSESEEEDDEMMLLILPALYLASTGYEAKSTLNRCGAEWICEVLEDDRGQGYAKLRIEPHILREFSRYVRSKHLLWNTRGVSVEEKIGMFVYMLSRNANFDQLSCRFEHSRETIHRHIKACFDAIVSLKGDFVKHPGTNTHWKILSDPHYGPYFENCIGAIDVIHVPLTISNREAASYRNTEGSLTQNVMLACDFDLNFVHVSSGREGSASDAVVLLSAIQCGFQVPIGKYYLVGGGYPNTPSFLAPYSGVPCHIEELEQRSCHARDYKELFNLRHAHLHNHIKNAIGLLKMRFPILKAATFYRVETQLKIPAAAVVLHNVIQRQGDAEGSSVNQTIPMHTGEIVALRSGDEACGHHVSALNNQYDTGDALRDDIAKRMWADYIRNM